jgi:hypothetical protein
MCLSIDYTALRTRVICSGSQAVRAAIVMKGSAPKLRGGWR